MNNKILFIDACPRKESRTRRLAEALAASLEGEVEKLVLTGEELPELTDAVVERRNEDCRLGNFDAPMYRYARQFAEADEVIIAAPFWDLSFPAILKKYIEAVTVNGITFRYSEEGVPIGLCRAKKLHYVATAGGPTFGSVYGFGYIKAMAQMMYGIPEVDDLTVENLDIAGNDPEKMVKEAIDAI